MGNSAGVTQEEVEALFDSDGDLREQTDLEDGVEEEASTEEEDTEEEPEAQEAEEEEDEEDPSPDEIDWDKVDPRVREAYEKAASEREKWQKNHNSIQSRLSKESSARKEQENVLAQIKARAAILDDFERRLEQNPRLQEMLRKELAAQANPFAAQVPDYLQNDPAYKYIQDNVAPYIQQLQSQIHQLTEKSKAIDTYSSDRETQAAQKQLDGHLQDAAGQVKAMLGRDASEEDITNVLQWMVENKVYNGKIAAKEVFFPQYEKAIRKKYETTQVNKSKKFGTRNKTVNSKLMGGRSQDASTVEEAIAMALSEQGIE